MKKSIIIKAQKADIAVNDYKALFNDIKSILENAQYRAYKAVDNIRVQTYWQVGERIVREELRHKERADYGRKVIQKLAKDLNIAKRNLHNTVRFYKVCPIVQTVSAQLSWSHIVELIYVNDKRKRNFYTLQIIQNNWSVRELVKQMKSGLYERMNEQGKIIVKRWHAKSLPEKIFKDTYNFDFLRLDEIRYEKTVEEALVKNVESLLLEFGRDFSLAGRQRKIVIDNQIHLVDMEFYHRGIPCIVIVDIKIGKFKSEYVGQMNPVRNSMEVSVRL